MLGVCVNMSSEAGLKLFNVLNLYAHFNKE